MKRASMWCCIGLVVVLPVLVLLSGCASSCVSSVAEAGRSKEIAEKSSNRFHAQLDAAQYEELYNSAHAEFRKATTHDDAIALFKAVHTKLGAVKQAKEQNFFVNFTTGGRFVRVTYETEFVEGKGTEEFVWRVEGEQAALVGYHINSMALITK